MAAKKQAQRSPLYPIVGLDIAIQKLEKFYNVEGQNTVSREAAIEALGYKGASGASLQMLATLIQYELLEKAGTGEIKISDIGLALIVGTETEKQESILKAAKKPLIFEEILNQFSSNKPSERSLLSFLIQRKPKGYVHSSAKKIINSFFDTMELANLYETEYNKPEPENNNNNNNDDEKNDKKNKDTPPMNPDKVEQVTFPLQEGQAILNLPKNLCEGSVEVLKKWFDFIISIKKPIEKAKINDDSNQEAN